MQKGFTLVELLIVIALLGALAIGLIGALDPFEQLKKGTDTGTRNTVSEIQSAVIRYYALKGSMPWCPSTGCVLNTTYVTSALLNTPASLSYLSYIIDTGELKSNFTTIQSDQLKKIYVTGTDQQVIVCYQPGSKSFRSDANTKFNADGTVDTTCGTTDALACFWCVQ